MYYILFYFSLITVESAMWQIPQNVLLDIILFFLFFISFFIFHFYLFFLFLYVIFYLFYLLFFYFYVLYFYFILLCGSKRHLAVTALYSEAQKPYTWFMIIIKVDRFSKKIFAVIFYNAYMHVSIKNVIFDNEKRYQCQWHPLYTVAMF